MHMDELKARKIWFCWCYETRNGKRTKVPISAYGTPTGTNTSADRCGGYASAAPVFCKNICGFKRKSTAFMNISADYTRLGG